MNRTLICKKEGMKYGTRRLKAGDRFEASGAHARILVSLKRAEYADGPRERVNVPPMPEALRDRVMAGKLPAAPAKAEPAPPAGPEPAAVEPAAADSADDATEVGDDEAVALSGLRAEYERAIGRRPYMGWDAETLRAKIDESKHEK